MSGAPGLSRWRSAMAAQLTRWSARRHGHDSLPTRIDRRRIYILPTRFGAVLAMVLAAMLIAGLNYNSNLGLAFGFLMTSLVLVAMHHCHRNLLGVHVDGNLEADGFAGGHACFVFRLRNDAHLERREIEVRLGTILPAVSPWIDLPPHGHAEAIVQVPIGSRGLLHLNRLEIRTRFPFEWFRAWTYLHVPLTAYIAPYPAGERTLPPLPAGAGHTAPAEQRGEEDFAGLRSYEAGVPLKHMAWKALAHGGEPAVRSYTALATLPEWFDWAELAPLDDEARLAQLCRWVLEADAARRSYGLRLPDIEIAPANGPTHRIACLRALAASRP